MFALMTMTRTKFYILSGAQRSYPHPWDNDDNDQVAVGRSRESRWPDKSDQVCFYGRQNSNHLLMITARNSSSFHYHSWWTLAIGLYLSTYVRRHSYVLALSPKGHSLQAMFCYDGSSHHNHITVYFDCVIISKRSRKYIRRIKITTRPLIQNHLLAYSIHQSRVTHSNAEFILISAFQCDLYQRSMAKYHLGMDGG